MSDKSMSQIQNETDKEKDKDKDRDKEKPPDVTLDDPYIIEYSKS